MCLGAVRRSDAALDRDGRFDDIDYLQGLSDSDREKYNRRNVFAFSLATAAHEVLQLVVLCQEVRELEASVLSTTPPTQAR